MSRWTFLAAAAMAAVSHLTACPALAPDGATKDAVAGRVTCDDEFLAAARFVDSVASDYQACRSTDDCTLVLDTFGCASHRVRWSTCGYAVNASQREAFVAEAERRLETYCAEEWDDRCVDRIMSASCRLPTLRCRDERCEASDAPVGEDAGPEDGGARG